MGTWGVEGDELLLWKGRDKVWFFFVLHLPFLIIIGWKEVGGAHKLGWAPLMGISSKLGPQISYFFPLFKIIQVNICMHTKLLKRLKNALKCLGCR